MHSPEIYSLLRQAYGSSSPLFFGQIRIFSETGLQQGDPLVSLCFSLAINSVISSNDCELNAWYLDDGVFGGSVGEVRAHPVQLERSFALLGFHLNHSKCEVPILSNPRGASPNALLAEVRRTMPGIVETARNSLVLLVSPLEDAVLDTSLAGYIDKIELMCSRVKNLDYY